MAACLPEFQTIQGEHIVYEYSDELHPCAGNAEYLDRAVPFLEQQLGVTAPAQIRYTWLTRADLERIPEWSLVGDPNAFAVGSHAMGTGPAILHEVVHLVMHSPTAPFFQEGIAVAYDSIYPEGDGPRYPHGAFLDPRATITATAASGVDYSAAGVFVTFLLTRHGPEKFIEFYTSLRWPYTLKRIGAVFRNIYGLDLNDEVDLFMAGIPVCEDDHFDLQFGDCSARDLPWSGPDWIYHESLECDAVGTVGKGGPRLGLAIFRPMTLEVAEQGLYELQTGNAPDFRIRFGPCFGCPWDFNDVNLDNDESVALDLKPGKYYLRVITDSDQPVEAAVTLRRLDG